MVLVIGLKPNTAVIKQFEDAFDRVIVLGEDKKEPGCIVISLSDAYIAAYGFDPEM